MTRQILKEDIYSQCTIDENNELTILIKEGVEECPMTIDEACEYCAEIAREYQMKKYGHLL